MAEKMREIGRVKQVQIQRSSLKTGEKPFRVYNPAPLLMVDHLTISPDGVVGALADGTQMIDVHNARHPATKNQGDNGISVNFTAHYDAMRAQFGAHLTNGCAGENILVEAEKRLTLDDLGVRLAFESAATGEITYVDNMRVAAPCVEFSHYVQQANLITTPLPAEQVKATLQFLGNGRRGFYATALTPAIIQPGDRVFAVET
jgi:MOSC domain-containing protein YiiM